MEETYSPFFFILVIKVYKYIEIYIALINKYLELIEVNRIINEIDFFSNRIIILEGYINATIASYIYLIK
ncbi:protein of unknown function [Tepidibacter aestuarii]|nr:protein of unknown function [Tepidibacter aestuarii]